MSVVIQANFYDDFNSNPLEVKEGTTTLKAIPPNSNSPFMIRSDNPDIDITQVSTKFLTFDTSESMKKIEYEQNQNLLQFLLKYH